MAKATKDKLLKRRLTEDTVTVPGVGDVGVRALSRAEVLKIKSQVRSEADAIKRQAEIERKMLAKAMVDPELTEDEVGEWQKMSAAGEIDLVANKVQDISGMAVDAEKAAYKEMDADPASEFRLPPG